jgi:hypothetical protein
MVGSALNLGLAIQSQQTPMMVGLVEDDGVVVGR